MKRHTPEAILPTLRREGGRVNRKRLYRLSRQEGLKVPRKQRKKRRRGHSDNSCVRRRAEHKNQVWTGDFLHDRTSDGRPLKWFTRIDEYTGACRALEVDRGMTAKAVQAVLAAVLRERGVPVHVRSDNGSEFISGHPGLDGGGGFGDVVPCSGCVVGKWLGGVVRRQGSGRTVERGGVWQRAGSEGVGQGMAAGVQPGPSRPFVGVSDAGRIREDVSSSRLRCATPGRGHICNG